MGEGTLIGTVKQRILTLRKGADKDLFKGATVMGTGSFGTVFAGRVGDTDVVLKVANMKKLSTLKEKDKKKRAIKRSMTAEVRVLEYMAKHMSCPPISLLAVGKWERMPALYFQR